MLLQTKPLLLGCFYLSLIWVWGLKMLQASELWLRDCSIFLLLSYHLYQCQHYQKYMNPASVKLKLMST